MVKLLFPQWVEGGRRIRAQPYPKCLQSLKLSGVCERSAVVAN